MGDRAEKPPKLPRPVRRRPVRKAVEHLRRPDRYDIVLVLILLALILLTAIPQGGVGRVFVSGLLSVGFVYTIYTSRARILGAALVAALLVFLVSLVASLTGSSRLADGFSRGPAIVLVVLTPLAIGRRLTQHPVVNARTIMGALCIYLLLGMFFGFVYALLEVLGLRPFFVQNSSPRPVDYAYFSFVTLTTVGYGDLTPVPEIARMLAVTEALLGQFYLVTVVALLVSHAGRQRSHHGDAP